MSLKRKLINLQAAISDGHCTARFLARIAGSVISCALAVGPISRSLTRQMYFEFRGSLPRILRLLYCKSSDFGTQILIVLTVMHTIVAFIV